jgi:DNA polymerase-3 subunit delta'
MHQILSQIIGNDPLKNRLAADIRHGSLSHAYIIEGKKGCGKHTVARTVAAAINCLEAAHDPQSVPCSVCLHCRKILGALAQDVITVTRENGKATLGVDAVRKIRADVAAVPSELDKKVYIIEDADTMTVQAQNALLLTLEEPPPFVVFFLLCENARSLLETIRSRAPVLRVEPLQRETVDAFLQANDPRAKKLKTDAPADYAAVLTTADGSIGEALRYLDPTERKRLFKDRAAAEALVNACIDRLPTGRMLSLLASYPQKRPELIAAFSLFMTAIRDLIALTKADRPHLCFYADADTASELAADLPLSSLAQAFSAASDAIDALLKNASVPLTLVNFAASVSA